MQEKYKLTPDGYNQLKEEYKDLKNVKRVKIAAQIQSARELGDIQNNLAYDYSLEQQGMVESRLTELDNILANAEVVEKNDCSCAQLGNKVTVKINGKTKRVLQLVSWLEADPTEGKISTTSPVGAALLDKKVGETVVVDTPISSLEYRILEIS